MIGYFWGVEQGGVAQFEIHFKMIIMWFLQGSVPNKDVS